MRSPYEATRIPGNADSLPAAVFGEGWVPVGREGGHQTKDAALPPQAQGTKHGAKAP